MDQAELEALVANALDEHPEVFPGSPTLVELLRKYGKSVSNRTILALDLPALQSRWTNSCAEKIFLENFSKGTFTSVHKKCKKASKERFRKIIETELKNNPDVFPSGPQISELLEKYGVQITTQTILRNSNIVPLQINWMTSSPEKAFLKNSSRGAFASIDKKCKEAAEQRFERIVETEVRNNPEVFPSSRQIAKLLSKKYGMKINLNKIVDNIDIGILQLAWIKSCPEKLFLENSSKRTFTKLDKKCKEAAEQRFERIVETEVRNNPEVFPSSARIAELLNKRNGTAVSAGTIAKFKLNSFQINWINYSSEKTFLENRIRGMLNNLDEKCRGASNKRFKKIIETQLENNPNIFPSNQQIFRLLKKYGIKSAMALSKLEIIPLQINWITSSSERVFLENSSEKNFSGLNEKCREAVKIRFKKIVETELDSNSEVFPSSPRIAELLNKKYGVKINLHRILDDIDIDILQLVWVNSCPEKLFLENSSKKRFTKLDKKCREAVKIRFKKIVETELEKNPDVLPGSSWIVELLIKKYEVNIGYAMIRNNLELPELQLKWLSTCDEKLFLENFSKGAFTRLGKKCREAAKQRFERIVETEVRNNPEVFPGGRQIAKLLSKKYGIGISKSGVGRNLDLLILQINWINSCPDKTFFENFSKGTFSGLDEKCKKAVKGRFKKIVETELNSNSEIFPGSPQILELLKKRRYGVITDLKTILRSIDIVSFQLKWIDSCSDEVFLENFSKKRFNNLDEKCKEAIKARLLKIAKTELEKNPRLFPSSRQIPSILKERYGVNIGLMAFYKNLDLSVLQLNLIKSFHEEIFLENLNKKAFTSLDKKCKVAVDRRLRDILLSNIDDLSNLPIGRTTLDKYLKKFPDLAFLLTATQEHKFTMDQRIVLDMHVWRETRSEDLHELIGERVEQLWGFRELFALMKDGRCLDADVISMFHESLPERIGNYIPESAVTHSFVDNLRSGDFKAGKGKDVLLLSFMHWLTDKQTAEIMLRLNQSVGTDNAIYMTSPNGLEYAENLIASMNTFGFVPEKVGSLYLLPSEESGEDEQRKLLTKGKVLQFRKLQDVERTPEELQLFLKEKRRTGGVRPEPKADIISYDEDTLRKSSPLITMKDVGIIFTEEYPKVKKVEVEDDKAILTLEGGVVLGFNVEPEHPYSIEVEGKSIPKGMDNAILDVMKGKEGFEVHTGLKRKYNQFLKMIKDKREQIGAVKKTKLKRKR